MATSRELENSHHWLGVNDAREALAAGQIVVIPTDTVWGFGIDPFAVEGPAALAALKGRDAAKPIAWLIGDREDLSRLGRDVTDAARLLAAEFWPGQVTLIVNASEAVPEAFAAAGTIGLRQAACRPTQILLRQVGHPLAVTSANRAGEPACLRLSDIPRALIDQTAGVLGPQANADFRPTGIASTVIDCTGGKPQLVRAGGIAWDRIEATLRKAR